ncbi:MAG: uroporphyrinogen-III synthase [Pseudomonadota bacterium]
MSNVARNPAVLVTRPRAEAEEMAVQLRKDGYTVYVRPLLDIHLLPTSLPDVLPEDVIVTSVHAVPFCRTYLASGSYRFYVVGARTADALRNAGHHDIMHVAPDADRLLTHLSDGQARPVLYICGQHTQADIPGVLSPLGFTVTRVPVYVADPAPVDYNDWHTFWAHTSLHIPLFSVRTATVMKQAVLSRTPPLDTSQHRVFCMSEKIADVVRDLGWAEIWVAHTPDLACMLTALRQRIITE